MARIIRVLTFMLLMLAALGQAAVAIAGQSPSPQGCKYPNANAAELIEKTNSDLAQRKWKIAGIPVKNLKAKFDQAKFVYTPSAGWLLPFGLYEGTQQVASMFSMVTCDGHIEYSSEWKKKP